MSNSLETEKLALDFLKGKENPFDSLARPQRLDDRFLDLHVPELLAGDRDLLLQIIDSYRVDEYTRSADLRPRASSPSSATAARARRTCYNHWPIVRTANRS